MRPALILRQKWIEKKWMIIDGVKRSKQDEIRRKIKTTKVSKKDEQELLKVQSTKLN